MVIDLPETVDTYTASVGSATRRELRRKDKRLRTDHPDISTEVVTPVTDSDALMRTFIAWKNSRFNARGESTIWQDKPDLTPGFVELLHRRGEAHITRIDGEQAAIDFLFPVGRSVYALQSGFDPRYEPYSLGFLSTYRSVCDAIVKGAASSGAHRATRRSWEPCRNGPRACRSSARRPTGSTPSTKAGR